MVVKIGYVRTRGTALFQTVDGNPRTTVCATLPCPRVDPNRGVIRLRTNSAQSTYDALQASFEKRLSRGFSGGLHFTYSSFIDNASELFNPSNGEIAVAQDSFDRNADKARSAFDRPMRLTGNVVYELPFYKQQSGFLGRFWAAGRSIRSSRSRVVLHLRCCSAQTQDRHCRGSTVWSETPSGRT